MSPFAIDQARFEKQATFDVSAAPNSPTGLPVKQISIEPFPMVVYKHPGEAFRVIEHRNTQHEVVHTETVPTEHLTRVVANEGEYTEALKEGWVKEPYIPQAPPDPNAHIYEPKLKKAGK